MQECLIKISEILIGNLNKVSGSGLLNGKMGICIFFYHLSRELKNPSYEKMADNLLDEIYSNISDKLQPLDFENGLAGIAWGLHYLQEQGFIEGDLDEVLEDLDDKIYQYISFSEAFTQSGVDLSIGFGFYALKRIENKNNKLSPDKIFCFQRLLINLVNNLSMLVEKDKRIVNEPPHFNLQYPLPLSLIFLNEVYKLSIYNSRIDKIFDFLSASILSTMPLSLGNRLYLLFAMKLVMEQRPSDLWEGHAKLLSQTIDIDKLLNSEFVNKQISLYSGKAGILLILNLFNNKFPECRINFDEKKLNDDIVGSSCWEFTPEAINPNILNVATGIPGIGFILMQKGQTI